MLDPKGLDELARKLAENLPSGIRDFQQEAEKNIKTTLHGMFSRMDLVTREEFDAQSKVLGRTREKLEDLERRLAALEGGDSDSADS